MSSPREPFDDIDIPEDLPEDSDTADEWDEDRVDNIGHNGNEGDHYPHLGCPSYPNCDIDPQGCRRQTKNVDWYGHRD
jgi:hypothetical protein